MWSQKPIFTLFTDFEAGPIGKKRIILFKKHHRNRVIAIAFFKN